MRRLLLTTLVLAGLAYPEVAGAGCWATVTLAPPPAGTAAGDVWTARLTVLQHGRNPLPDAADARPTLTISNGAAAPCARTHELASAQIGAGPRTSGGAGPGGDGGGGMPLWPILGGAVAALGGLAAAGGLIRRPRR